MLKFKIKKDNMGVDEKVLNIVKTEKIENEIYYGTDGEYGGVHETNDEITYKFWVKDLFSIQPESRLTSISSFTIENTPYKYVNSVTVASVMKSENTFTISVPKEMQLKLADLHIETRHRAIIFSDKRWKMVDVTQKWIEKISKTKECIRFKTNQVVYGETANGGTEVKNTVFYYENDCWQTIELEGKTLEDCLNTKDMTINFGSFKLYDENVDRKCIKIEEDKIYYCFENYISIDMYQTHYFTSPFTEYDTVTIEDGREICNTTEYGRAVIKNITYPYIYIYVERTDEITGIPYVMKVKKEVYIKNEKCLIFNYDFENEDDVFRLNARVLDREGNERKIETKEIETITDMILPYGYAFNIDDEGNTHIRWQNGSIGGIEVYRNNMLYDEDECSFSLIYDTSVNVIQIPISQKFENDLFHNDMIKEHFADKMKQNSINPIIDMEKEVYIPVIQHNSPTQINAKYDECFKLIFNLHFREHRDVFENGQKEEWRCDEDCFWNGTKVLTKKYKNSAGEDEEKRIIDLKGRVYNYDIKNEEWSKNGKTDYFSYYGEAPIEPVTKASEGYDNVSQDYNLGNYEKYKRLRNQRTQLTEYQSDLLSYLGFTNDDIKFQKSKVKKSFLRISFYDSDNYANQNLLHTSTIFLDSGDLFAKYIKNIETENVYKTTEDFTAQENPNITYKNGDILSSSEYERLSYDKQKKCVFEGNAFAITGSSATNSDTVYDKIGVRVNREPMRNEAIDKANFVDSIEDIEEMRMSAQIVVSDKYSSKHSSEGFYFYTYKGNDNGVYPSDIYMRVDFNHAGYGRTIPFMMPYIRDNEENLEKTSPGYERYTKTKRDNKIKTFDDICYDWSDVDFDRGIEGTEYLKEDYKVGYSTVKYMKYCYIKWKYRYDKTTQKHIYYLDPDVYGTGVTSNNSHSHNIILNLYEGKIR